MDCIVRDLMAQAREALSGAVQNYAVAVVKPISPPVSLARMRIGTSDSSGPPRPLTILDSL